MSDFFGFCDLKRMPSGATESAWARLVATTGLQHLLKDATLGLKIGVASSGRERVTTATAWSFEQESLSVRLLGQAPHPQSGEHAVDPDPSGRLRELAASGRCASAALLADLEGSWTALVVDGRERTFTCIRKGEDAPALAWFIRDEVVWFGSRLPVLRRMPLFPTGVDHSAISFLLAYARPPAGRTLFRGVQQLRDSEALEVSATGVVVRNERSAKPATPGTGSGEILGQLRDVVRDGARDVVSGRRIRLVGHQDPRSAWLLETLREAGAAEVVMSNGTFPQPLFDETLALAQRSIVAEGEVFADPLFVELLGQVGEIGQEGEVCVVPLGSTTLLPNAQRHRRLAERLTAMGGRVRRTSGANQFLQTDIGFVRDLYFEESALCDDAFRIQLSGPLLAQWGAFAMADELGPGLEGATPDTVASHARDLDSAFLVPGLRSLVAGVARSVRTPIFAPFLAAPVQDFAGRLTSRERFQLGEHLGDWPGNEGPGFAAMDRVVSNGENTVRALLQSQTFISRGLFGQVAVSDLIERQFRHGGHKGALIWSLCLIELWFRNFVDFRR